MRHGKRIGQVIITKNKLFSLNTVTFNSGARFTHETQNKSINIRKDAGSRAYETV